LAINIFTKQIMMRRVIYSLIPIYAFAFWAYGWHLLVLSLVVFAGGIFSEYMMERRQKKKVSEAVLVTCMLFTLSLPPLTPWWIALIGILFGVIIGKEAYGGFGRNVFNPAIVGRLFVYIAFPGEMTARFLVPGGFGSNAITSATPLSILREGETLSIWNTFIGNRAGAMGEGPILLILLAAIYLMYTKTASWRIILSTLASSFALILALDIFGVARALPVFHSFISGSILFVMVFMATDPVSAPKKPQAQWLYGMIIGVSSVLVRTFSLFPEGTSFGVLIGNTFASLIDLKFSKPKKVNS